MGLQEVKGLGASLGLFLVVSMSLGFGADAADAEEELVWKIAFTSSRDGTTDEESDIYVMNTDGTHPVRLTYSGSDKDPAWSPDGS